MRKYAAAIMISLAIAILVVGCSSSDNDTINKSTETTTTESPAPTEAEAQATPEPLEPLENRLLQYGELKEYLKRGNETIYISFKTNSSSSSSTQHNAFDGAYTRTDTVYYEHYTALSVNEDTEEITVISTHSRVASRSTRDVGAFSGEVFGSSSRSGSGSRNELLDELLLELEADYAPVLYDDLTGMDSAASLYAAKWFLRHGIVYEDSLDFSAALCYQVGESLFDAEDYKGSMSAFAAVRGYRPDLEDRTLEATIMGLSVGVIRAGDIINFGELEWLVLDVDDKFALVLTTDVISNDFVRSVIGGNYSPGKSFSATGSNFLRWFSSAEERARILMTGDTGSDEIKGGLFYLSKDEAETYFLNSTTSRLAMRIILASPDQYANERNQREKSMVISRSFLENATIPLEVGDVFSLDDIEWGVLDIDDQAALIIALDDSIPKSHLRHTFRDIFDIIMSLNGEFYENLYYRLRERILDSVITGRGDKVFLLSLDEAIRYADPDSDSVLSSYGGTLLLHPIDLDLFPLDNPLEDNFSAYGYIRDGEGYRLRNRIEHIEVDILPAMWISMNPIDPLDVVERNQGDNEAEDHPQDGIE